MTKEKDIVPYYLDWNRCWSNFAERGKYSYEFIHPNGHTRLYIDPYASVNGRYLGYVAHSWSMNASDAWRQHGKFRSAREACQAIRQAMREQEAP